MIIINSLLPISFPMPLKSSVAKIQLFDVDRDNATRVRFQDTKLNQATRTIGGFIVSHWGDNLPVMSVEGSVILLPGQEALGMLSLLVLRSLYRLDKKDISKIYSYIGKFISAGLVLDTAVGEYMNRLEQYQNIAQSSGTATAELASNAIIGAVTGIGLIDFMKQRDSQINNLQNLANSYIWHDNYLYSGFFTQFQYTRDVQNYRKINYSFNFTVDNSTEFAVIENLLLNGGDFTQVL